MTHNFRFYILGLDWKWLDILLDWSKIFAKP